MSKSFKVSPRHFCKPSSSLLTAFEPLEGRTLRSVTLPTLLTSTASQLIGTASTEPAVASSGSNGVVTTTQQGVGLLDGTEVYAQRLNAAGAAVGSPIHVNQTTVGNQAGSTVSMTADGSFVVGWISGTRSYVRLFNADGTPATNEIAVTPLLDHATDVAVAAGTDGKALVLSTVNNVVTGNDVVATLYNADGTVAQAAQMLNTNSLALGDQSAPAVAALPGGSYITAWQSNVGSGTGYDIVMQRISSTGARLGANQVVNDITAGNQLTPDLVYNQAQDEIAVVYQTTNVDTGDISMILLNADGSVKVRRSWSIR